MRIILFVWLVAEAWLRGKKGKVFDVLLLLRLCGGDVAGVYLFDGLIGVDCGLLLVEGGQVLVDFLEGLFHFYFGTGQHQLAFNYFELYLTVIQ